MLHVPSPLSPLQFPFSKSFIILLLLLSGLHSIFLQGPQQCNMEERTALTPCSYAKWWLQEHAIFHLQDGNPLKWLLMQILFRSHNNISGQKRRNTCSQNKINSLNRFLDSFTCQTEVICWSPGKAVQTVTHPAAKYLKWSFTEITLSYWKQKHWKQIWQNEFSSVRGWLTMSFSAILFQFWRWKSLADVVTAEKCKQMH